MGILSAAITLFLILDPFGNVPIFLSILKSYDAQKRRKIIIREMLIALVVLTLFLFQGNRILSLMGITGPAVSISGGIILFIIALRMIFPDSSHKEGSDGIEPIVVPLAVPLVAGPSAIAMVTLFTSKEPDRIMDWFIALILAWTASFAIILISDLLQKLLGNSALKAIERFMGMILTALATQMLLSGVKDFMLLFFPLR